LVDMAQTHGGDVLARASSRGGYRLRPDTAAHQTLENPALFQGLSGIGYQFLRLAHPDIVPSLLLFH
jgi:lantibiotic modifying enzyme